MLDLNVTAEMLVHFLLPHALCPCPSSRFFVLYLVVRPIDFFQRNGWSDNSTFQCREVVPVGRFSYIVVPRVHRSKSTADARTIASVSKQVCRLAGMSQWDITTDLLRVYVHSIVLVLPETDGLSP